MPKDKFDLAAAISGIVSESNTGAPEVKMIPLTDIIPNPANFYAIGKKALRPLMDSIAMDGLHHYPLVMKHPKEEGKWQLIDGERRYTACRELVKEGHEEFKSIPCTVREYASTALAELQLILSNSTNRVLSNAEIMKQAEKTELLFYQLKEEGYEFPGRMRDQVAAACKVSASKLARLKVIREGLVADLMYLFEKNRLSEQAAYALARMPVELQSRIAEIRKGDPLEGDVAERVLKKSSEGWKWDAVNLKCPDGKACPGGDRFLRCDLERKSWERMCGGNTCCLNCEAAKESYSPCERMCSKAKALRKDEREAAEEKAAKEAKKAARKYQVPTQENARRLLKAIDAAGLEDSVVIPWEYYSSYPVSDVRRFAEGDFENSGSWYGARLAPEALCKPAKVCELLKCSADYLLGLTDDLHGGGELAVKWMDGQPSKEGQYVAKFRIKGEDAPPMIKLAFWKNFGWCFNNGATIDAECIGWWPIPEEE